MIRHRATRVTPQHLDRMPARQSPVASSLFGPVFDWIQARVLSAAGSNPATAVKKDPATRRDSRSVLNKAYWLVVLHSNTGTTALERRFANLRPAAGQPGRQIHGTDLLSSRFGALVGQSSEPRRGSPQPTLHYFTFPLATIRPKRGFCM